MGPAPAVRVFATYQSKYSLTLSFGRELEGSKFLFGVSGRIPSINTTKGCPLLCCCELPSSPFCSPNTWALFAKYCNIFQWNEYNTRRFLAPMVDGWIRLCLNGPFYSDFCLQSAILPIKNRMESKEKQQHLMSPSCNTIPCVGLKALSEELPNVLLISRSGQCHAGCRRLKWPVIVVLCPLLMKETDVPTY